MKNGIQVGLKNLYYAILTQDDQSGVAYGTPQKIARAISAKITTKTNTTTLYADDGPADTATAIGETDLELGVTDLSLEIQAALLGHTITGGVLTKKTNDVAPYVAVGFSSEKSNGKTRFMWLYKGRFEIPSDDLKTKEDKVAFQTPTIKATFIRRDNDNSYEKIADEDHPDYVASIGTNWFTVVDGTPDTTPPTVTVAPANNAATVAANSAIIWTFNEAIQVSTVNTANFMVQKADGTAQIVGTLSIDAAKKVVTFQPSANLAATTQYMAIATVGVKDIAGNALAAPSVTKFTTA